MTASPDRRGALVLGLAGAVATTFVSTPAVALPVERLIDPPEGPMRYTRSVTRDLIDGTPFTVTRHFRIVFQPFAEGFMLHGEQQDVRVDGPEVLAPFAELERARDESGLFPIALNAFGQILSSQIAAPAGPHLRQAVDEAVAEIASHPIGEDEHQQVAQFLRALQQVGNRVTAHLPLDLFAPSSQSRHEERDIVLPGGVEGKVESVFEAERDERTGLMREASRSVMTRVAQTSRGTRERWSLSGF
ncbi:hypothetical protein [Aurantiacibacter odishensis]|uniref:hypothetical protein n=1 Tax=Aurantiacibacter odishensis TaxID=1155476 RepID=UPI0013C41FA1|nr:hypothetical protein [Aurantiacibacter odishensis]